MNNPLKIQSVLKAHPQTRIAVLRSLPGLGDLLCSVPALKALRTAFPSAEITLIGLPHAKSFVQRFHQYVDSWLDFPGFPGIPEVPVDEPKLFAFLEQTRCAPFDLALQLHGNGSSSNAFLHLLEARLTAGFYPMEGHCPQPRFFLPYPESGSEICRLVSLMEFLGIRSQGFQLEFPITEQDWQDWHKMAARVTLTAPYVCIHPGASIAARRWHPHYFARVADQLAALGLQVVLTGSSEERSLTEAIANQMQMSPVNLAGCTSLGALAILLKGAQLLICNDTGVSHLAAALQTKSVVIFSDSDPQRWAPLNWQRHRVVQVNAGERSPGSPTAKATHSIQQVVAEASYLLNLEFSYAS
jgi:ADP-heptose:LPS heptosyltransferase